MAVSSYLLLAMAILGAADILFFHTLAHRLRTHVPARAELVTHALRGPTYAALFVLVPNVECRGAWFFVLCGTLAFDVAISIADFWLEPASRRERGGLPRGEYLLHVVLAMLFGALVVTVIDEGAAARALPTALVWIDAGPPWWVRVGLGIAAPLVLATGLMDAWAVRRLGRVAA